MVRESGGLSISFNGNDYAIRESEIAVLSADTTVISVLAESFNRNGKKQVFRLVEEFSPSGLKKFCVSPELRKRMSMLFPDSFPQVERVNDNNIERLKMESSFFRKTVRGESIGKLG